MTWREAFLEQARSDFAMFDLLNEAKVPQCHVLHYLQMATEKLAKALSLSPRSQEAPPFTHAILVVQMQMIHQNRYLRAKLRPQRDGQLAALTTCRSLFGSQSDRHEWHLIKGVIRTALRIKGSAPERLKPELQLAQSKLLGRSIQGILWPRWSPGFSRSDIAIESTALAN